METHLLEKAIRLAVRAHEGQLRKDGEVPYITHPLGVTLILAKHGFGDEVLSAALTHDVVEDTVVTNKELREELGDTVADIVASVTHDDTLGWEEKKIKYIKTVREGGEGAKAVATADKIHNAECLIITHKEKGTKMWDQFNAGKEKKIWFEESMLRMLQETWRHPLIDEYEVLLKQMKELE